MRVLLISSNVACTPYPTFPLGMSMVSSALRHAGHQVQQIDFLMLEESTEALLETVGHFDPDFIGVSIRNVDNVNMINEQRYIDVVGGMVASIKQMSSAPVILGGSGFSVMPEEILQVVGADYGIVGEGEQALVSFLDRAARGHYPADPVIRTAPSLTGRDIPQGDYEDSILSFYLQSGNMASVQTKRGCTHRCVYCSYPVLEGRDIRCRDPKEVADDVQRLVEHHQAKYIFFTDSVFNDDQGRYLEIVGEMHERKINVPWTAFFKPAAIDDEHISMMKDTGLQAAEIGADAATDETLRRLGKGFDFDKVEAFNQQFADYEIATAHYFMIGGPGETKATVEQGIRNIVGLQKTVSFIFMGIRVIPGTPLAKLALREGLVGEGQNLLDPVYYLSPGLDRGWLEETLTRGFAPFRHCIFPPDRYDTSLRFLHKLGYSGSMWDMLLKENRDN